MLFHRWETVSHIISDTKLPWTKTIGAEEEDEYDGNDDSNGKIHIIS